MFCLEERQLWWGFFAIHDPIIAVSFERWVTSTLYLDKKSDCRTAGIHHTNSHLKNEIEYFFFFFFKGQLQKRFLGRMRLCIASLNRNKSVDGSLLIKQY